MIPAVTITVCDSCAHRHLELALRDARRGTRIILVGGEQRGHFIVRTPLEIVGREGASIDAGGAGTALRIEASNVTVQHLTFRGSSGDDESGDQAAIVAAGTHVRISDDRFIGNTFGLSLVQAHSSVVARNQFVGSGDVSREGDAIRVFASNHVTVEDNTVSDTRDIVFFFSEYGSILRNHVYRARYGFHDMYSNHLLVAGNVIQDCQIGSNFMYANDVRIFGNVFAHNRGPTGYGSALENVDRATIVGNGFFDNRVGLQIVQSPSDSMAQNVIRGNRFDDNGTALAAESSTARTTVVGNDFGSNLEQVRIDGGPSMASIRWSEHGRGNYWSDYAGYDRSGSGIGSMPYAPRGAYEALSDANPVDQWFSYSPAATMLDFAARAVPVFAPPAKLVDSWPLMLAPPISIGPPTTPGVKNLLAEWALGGFALAGFPLIALGFATRPRLERRVAEGPTPSIRREPLEAGQGVVIAVDGLTKRYPYRVALLDVSFSLRTGEVLALWGPNGAGKTTIIRALLGQIWFEGSVSILGVRPTPTNADARTRIGYAPQHLPPMDGSMRELAVLVARLRGLPEGSADAALAYAQISGNAGTPVSSLSQGTQQRLAVALALMADPPIIILDEPAAGLDRASRLALMQTLEEQKARGKTIVFSSHLEDDVKRLADKVAMVEEGHVLSIRSVAEFSGYGDAS